MSHLLVAISSHGFGHAMQTMLVINALRKRLPNLQITLRTKVSPQFLAERLQGDFQLLPASSDFGMCMHSAVDIDLTASAAAYAAFHTNWSQKVAAEAQALTATHADLILADIPYLTLAGAQQAGIPAVALCSLNWADIYWHYCAKQPNARKIHQQMQAAYQSAQYFLQPEPAMPMTDLNNTRPIAPLAQIGTNHRASINQQLQLTPEQRLIVVAMGGMEMPLSIQKWPKMQGISMLVPPAWQTQRPDTFAWGNLNLAFIDILRSCDALITKPGYGTFTEAACNGIPLLYLERPDWPETAYLETWLKKHTRALSITRAQLEQGAIMENLQQLLAVPKPNPPKATGAEQAADLLQSLLQ
ncbi:MAG TPA: hypothetical protein ENI48_05665 [Thioploca sp.]|nr:hypothetical protein [Thioploca sp.]